MAKYKKLGKYDDKPIDEKAPDDPMREMRTRFQHAVDWDAGLRQMALDDYRFCWVPGNQWDPWLAKRRAKRPTYEFNTTKALVKQITNGQRQNRPQVKFSATNDGAKPLNEVMDGLFRNDWNVSSGDIAVDTAFRWAVSGGYGVFRANYRYSHEPSNMADRYEPSDFYKEIYWEEMPNPFCVRFDPSAKEYSRKDAQYAFVDERMSRNEFKQRFPGAEIVSFESCEPDQLDWWGQEDVRVCEYWYKEKEKVTIVMMSDGRVFDADQLADVADELLTAGVTEQARREIERDCVYRTLVSGVEELEKPVKWPGRYFPLVPVWGELSEIEGKPYYSGVVRFVKDAQALKNFHKSVKAELIAKAPKSPFMATPNQIKGFEEMYKNVGETDYSTLMYNEGPLGAPQRSAPPDVPGALIQASAEDNEDMKQITGLYDPSLGASQTARSGRAVLAEQAQGNTANFDFIDNLSRSLKFAGEIYADLAPKIYDTTRTRRVLGKDDSEDFIQLNIPIYDVQTGKTIYLNDLSQAQFDVTVNIGPSFASQRMEANEMLLKLSENPIMAPVVADLLAKTMDFPLADELEKRLRRIGIQQGIIEPDPENPNEKPGPSPQEQMLMQQIQQGEQAMQELAGQLGDMQKKLAQAEIRLQQSDDKQAIDAAKLQIDAYNAETNRLKVELEAEQAMQNARVKGLEAVAKIEQTVPIVEVVGTIPNS